MIRNFLYLDSQKLRSLSSQLFDGLTEQVLMAEKKEESKSEQQKGPFSSGQILADIFATERSTSELRFMEDHAYTLFENALAEKGIVRASESNRKNSRSVGNFIKVSSFLQINDLSATSKMLGEFNDLGEALWRIGNEPMSMEGSNAKLATDAEARKKAAAIGLQMNKKVTDSAAKLVNFGFKDLLEVSMIEDSILYSAPLKREFLRESENMILHKYSRVSEAKFTIIGVITQTGASSDDSVSLPDVADADGIKQAMRSLAVHLRTVEQVFAGPTSNEIVIDPIAVYSEIGN